MTRRRWVPRRATLQRWARRLTAVSIMAAYLGIAAVAASVAWLHAGAAGHVYSERDVPAAPVALVLGAQAYPDGSPSPFLAARLAIAQRLLESGKVRVILVSGDHREWRYNEPGVMWQWLVDHGVPVDRIVADYAGFDTYDSCTRANRIFGVRKAIVVTQSYHIPRAVTLCRQLGVTAYGVGDDTMKQFHKPWGISSTREYGACLKAVWDVVSGRDPVFLGPRETSVDDALKR